MKVTMKVEGLRELEQKLLKDLPAAIAGKILRNALNTAVNPMLKAARENARTSERTGALKKAIKKASGLARGQYAAVAGIRIGSGFRSPKSRWHFIEFGTKDARAQPYLRPAFDSTKLEAIQLFKENLRKRIQDAVRK